jgi:hypothetical protein
MRALQRVTQTSKLEIMRYNSNLKNIHQTSFSTSTLTSKTVHLTVSKNVATLAGTLVLNRNRILS